MCSLNMASSESSLSDFEQLSDFETSDNESQTARHSELPQGSERDLIKHYFDRGLAYRQITLMLEKYHNIVMNIRTLKRRLKDYGCARRTTVDNELRRRVREVILSEIMQKRPGPS